MRWTVSSQDYYTVERAFLKPIGEMWYHFLKNRLMPSTHNTIISKDRMLLLHSIIMRRRINIGRIIFREVYRCAKKNASSVNFPSLITALYRTARVPLNAFEDVTLIRVDCLEPFFPQYKALMLQNKLSLVRLPLLLQHIFP
ncbi:hypothetical protein J1N35_013864, partial [Gossypium stocksii]